MSKETHVSNNEKIYYGLFNKGSLEKLKRWIKKRNKKEELYFQIGWKKGKTIEIEDFQCINEADEVEVGGKLPNGSTVRTALKNKRKGLRWG